MAAASGDMRRALEACTAALEQKVQEAVAEQAELAAHPLVPGGLMLYTYAFVHSSNNFSHYSYKQYCICGDQENKIIKCKAIILHFVCW